MVHRPRSVAAAARAAVSLGLLSVACGGRAEPAKIPDNALRAAEPRLIGRFDVASAAGPRFSWPGSAIEVRFVGTGLAVRLRAPPLPKRTITIAGVATAVSETAAYSVVVDGRRAPSLEVSDRTERYEVVSDLNPGREHVVTITREAEASAGVHQLVAVELATGGELLPPRAGPRLRLELVGDSITCGYGVLGPDATCPFSYATESVTLAYGGLVARALDADAITVAWSGRGVYRNYDAGDDPLMPELYERTIPQEVAAWPFASAPQPDAVVVNLGTNDFLADHDRDGAPDPVDTAAFEAAFVRFLTRVREVRAGAWIFVATSPMLSGELLQRERASLADAVERRRAAGDARVELVDLEPQGTRMGCDGHPNADMHRILARQIEAALRAKLGR